VPRPGLPSRRQPEQHRPPDLQCDFWLEFATGTTNQAVALLGVGAHHDCLGTER
jgi:hypothetical protein